MKTFMANAQTSESKTYVIDADGQILGHLAVKAATILRGKHKPTFTPHADCGDMVIVINAEKVRVSGNKFKNKMYKKYTGYHSGLREISFEKLQAKAPEQIIRLAVNRMLPSGALGNKLRSKLRVYVGTEHSHTAQKPEVLTVS